MKLSDDDFTLLGLPQTQALDRPLLDARRRELQAQVHPDRFASDDAAAQRLAMQWAVRVNEAYQRLKDPLSRAAYLCELRGVPVQAERNTAMPAAFLLQQMQWREALEEADTLAAVDDLHDEVLAFYKAQLAQLAQHIDGVPDLAQAAQVVRGLMFVEKFLLDLQLAFERYE